MATTTKTGGIMASIVVAMMSELGMAFRPAR